MDIPVHIYWAIIAVQLFLWITTLIVLTKLNKRLLAVTFENRSQSVKYGLLTEQFLPLVETYPWDATKFRFLGSPIDGIQFEEDRIILVEFKTGKSQLSSLQRKLRDLVESGKVEFEVVRIG
jgi:predicted Holliday junction resolvase-like endonuclease